MPVVCIKDENKVCAYVDYLRVNNPNIVDVKKKSDNLCIEFTGSLTLSYEDYKKVNGIDINRDYVERVWFLKRIVQPAIATVRGAAVTKFDANTLTVEFTGARKTEVVHVRVSPEERKRLEEEAKKHGMTLSDYIRCKLFGG